VRHPQSDYPRPAHPSTRTTSAGISGPSRRGANVSSNEGRSHGPSSPRTASGRHPSWSAFRAAPYLLAPQASRTRFRAPSRAQATPRAKATRPTRRTCATTPRHISDRVGTMTPSSERSGASAQSTESRTGSKTREHLAIGQGRRMGGLKPIELTAWKSNLAGDDLSRADPRDFASRHRARRVAAQSRAVRPRVS
jgi:hypothetical protein